MSGSDLPAIDIQQLTFTHTTPGALLSDKPFVALRDVNFSLPRGSRTLLVGGNGAGKSTLLYILAGKRMIQKGSVKVLGRDVFKDFPPNVVYLGTEWAMNTGTRGDIVVSDFLNSVGGYRHKERRDHLLDILDINLDWHMHHISDGERRRVQLCMGLMGEWDILLLDEVTVDLDVLVRDQLLEFLQQETIERNATVVYATHIFDGLNTFPTHIAHMCDGQFTLNPTPWPLQDLDTLLEDSKAKEHFLKSGSSIHALALSWLSNDRTVRVQAEKEGKRRKVRGARAQTITSDSETFYKKYDYSH
ncbi:MAG: P-loop containing nucleoside triphosphate hydrolase protein [Lentinula lateritia]|uniref:P-loop containing nucleoside triphosphate hydrolase protein n=1 Tax=Lentinula lateritia TaxID=40482 RepID=A0ABQ8VNP3_9AGAR|nr:MAG: P-loop containing nucleoside triphosphate hydrolase protein [Lentinula lateritia]KAJ4498013.1 P-loop containing nucleoside triphosphate hydrolase protein [Lentinula lateritia]